MMMFLWLLTLAVFAVAMAYFTVLCVYEILTWRRADQPKRRVNPVTSVKRLTSELRFMTREMSPLFGFGDD